MKLKNIYLKNVLLQCKEKRKLVLVSCLVCFVLFTGLGWNNSKKQVQLSEEQQQEIDEYNQALEDYDTAIAELQESITLIESQRDDQQKYIDGSLYMKLDSTKLQTASVQYSIQNAQNQGNVLGALTSTFNDGFVMSALNETYGEDVSSYLKEVIWCGTNNNLFIMSVNHTDMEEAKKILKVMEKAVESQKDNIASKQGAFDMALLKEMFNERNDTGILNNQNTNNTNLKNYINNHSDMVKKVVDQKTNKANYIKNYEPEVLEAQKVNPVVVVLKYMVVGIVFGVALPIVYVLLQDLLSDRIRNTNDLKKSDMTVLGRWKKESFVPSAERMVLDVKQLCKVSGQSAVCLNLLADGDGVKGISETFADTLKKADITCTLCTDTDNAAQMEAMIEAKNSIMVVEAGKTTYTQIEKHRELCQKFGVELWGCIVVE